MLRAKSRATVFALTLIALIAAGAFAQDAPTDPDSAEKPKSYSWGVGFAGLTQQQPYTGIDRSNFAIPVIFFENRWVELMGPTLDLKLPSLELSKSQELKSGVRVQLFGFNGYKPKDAPILNGMKERKSGIFAGPFVKWSNPVVDVFGEWMVDVASESKGQRATIGLERSMFVGKHIMFTPTVSASWLDQKYADYYYGVRSEEARPDRPAHVMESTMNADLSLRTDYLIDQHQAVFVTLQHTMLGSEIKDSPLTDRSSETMVLVGYLFRF